MVDRLLEVAALRGAHVLKHLGSLRRRSAIESYECWGTPRKLYSQLDAEFHFHVDVAATPFDSCCPAWIGPDTDSLTVPWAPMRCYMNPPYAGAEVGLWTKKAADEARSGSLVVGLLPARTDSAWFHRDILGEPCEVRFLRGRLKMVRGHGTGNAAFPQMIVVWANG